MSASDTASAIAVCSFKAGYGIGHLPKTVWSIVVIVAVFALARKYFLASGLMHARYKYIGFTTSVFVLNLTT